MSFMITNLINSAITMINYNDISHLIWMISHFPKKDPRDVFLYYPRNPSSKTGVYAVRYMNYKAHFYTKGKNY